jgi:molybdopterin synthase catalytic subunit
MRPWTNLVYYCGIVREELLKTAENLHQDRQAEILTRDLRNIKQECHTLHRHVRVHPKRQM